MIKGGAPSSSAIAQATKHLHLRASHVAVPPSLMPCLRLPRGLRRALKGLSSAVQNGQDRLARAKPASSAATAFRSVLRQARSLPGGWSRGVEFGSWTRTLTARRCVYERPRSTRRLEPVYVDELVGRGSGQRSCLGPACTAAAGAGPGPGPSKLDPRRSSRKGPVMAWEVDERAQEFIERFREETRLQREKSFEDFKEMLARGAR